MHVGPHPRRLNGTLGTSHSSAPFRNRSEAFDTARSSQSLGQAEVPRAVLPEVKSEEDRSISRNLCSANEAYRAGIFREFSIAGQQRNALHSRLGHKDAIEGILVSGI